MLLMDVLIRRETGIRIYFQGVQLACGKLSFFCVVINLETCVREDTFSPETFLPERRID